MYNNIRRILDIHVLQLVKTITITTALLLSTSAVAHEMTPTYFQFKPSFVDNVKVTTVNIWNRREDVQYYEVSVLDKFWNRVSFATRDRIIKLPYLKREKIDIYIKQEDVGDVEYICTSSKQLKSDVQSTGIKSMICSRIER